MRKARLNRDGPAFPGCLPERQFGFCYFTINSPIVMSA